jgi:polyisoprenyl-phosphate glycosyltransferase
MYDVIIPARNEAVTVGHIVAAAKQARGVGKVIVVDDHSTDGTAKIARDAGAIVVLSKAKSDKAKALATGAALSRAPILVFFDADIRRVQPSHIEALVEPIWYGYSMSCGLVDYGPKNAIYLRLPPITGMRALKREIFMSIPEKHLDKYNIEALVNSVIARKQLPSAIRVLTGTSHRTKITKRGYYHGILAHIFMVRQLIACYAFSSLRNYWNYRKHNRILAPTHARNGSPIPIYDEWR